MRRVLPAPLFFTEVYLQSSIPISIHLTQRGVLGTHLFERQRGRWPEITFGEWLMRFGFPSQSEMELPLSEFCEDINTLS